MRPMPLHASLLAFSFFHPVIYLLVLSLALLICKAWYESLNPLLEPPSVSLPLGAFDNEIGMYSEALFVDE